MNPGRRTPPPAASVSGAERPRAAKRKAHALTQAQLVRQLLKVVGPSRPARSSIRLVRGPRGQVMPEVLIHAGDEPGLTTIEAIEAKAVEVFDRLSARYPLETSADEPAPAPARARAPRPPA